MSISLRTLGGRVSSGVSFLLLACLSAVPAAAEEPGLGAKIDSLLAARWHEAGVEPAEPATDAEFLRRASLDLTGRIPRASLVRSFLADTRPDKRAKLIEQLLSGPNHATHLANTWRNFLLPQGTNLRRFGGAISFQNWLREQFVDNVPYDQMVRKLLLASGQVNQSGPALFYTALKVQPEELAANTSRVFLGVQIQCAQCHDHPFDHWSQKDFWGYAAFFAQLQRPANPQQFVAQVADAETGEVKLPDSDEVMPPRWLGGKVAEPQPDTTRRQQLALWLTAAENPFFARAAVNRVWAHLFGRGLVDPVDDFGNHNPASHPELLDLLAASLVASDFDLKQLFRTLTLTEAYQRSSTTRSSAPPSEDLFAQMAIKTLTAEQLYACLADATVRREATFGGAENVALRFYDQNRQAFLAKFRAPAAGATEYQLGIPQALTLMNGRLIESATDLANSDILVSLSAPFFSDEERVETLFLTTLARLPNDEERSQFVGHVQSGKTVEARARALSDVLWALLNSAEFTLNH